jgi:5'-nucleotidase/UDP-sugar diphosphatase
MMAVVLGLCGWFGAGMASETVSLLYFNDFHSQIDPRPGTHGEQRGGVAHLAGAVRIVRGSFPGSLLLDAGDFVQGTPYFNAFGGAIEVEAQNLMGVDAAVLGNHEFDNGTRALPAMLAGARFPVLSANLLIPDSLGVGTLQNPNQFIAFSPPLERVASDLDRALATPPGRVRPALPYALYRVGETRVAVVGVTTEDLSRLVISTTNPGIETEPAAPAVRRWVDRLRPQTDLLVVLSHAGVGPDSALAVSVPGIDVIVDGHDHVALSEPKLIANDNHNGIAGTLLVEAGSRGDFLGHLILEMQGARILSFRGRLLPVGPAVPPDPDVAKLVASYRDRLGDELGEVIATAPRGLSAEGTRSRATALGAFVSEVMRRAASADIGFQNSGAIRASIPPGPVTLEDAYRVLPFENTIMRCVMSGEEVFELLRFAVAQGGDGGFPQLAGVTIRVEDGRLLEVTVAGAPLDPQRDYVVATNNYLFTGGDGYTQFGRARGGEDTGMAVRDAFVEAARAAEVLLPEEVPAPAR